MRFQQCIFYNYFSSQYKSFFPHCFINIILVVMLINLHHYHLHHRHHHHLNNDDHHHDGIRNRTTSAPQFLKYVDCCGFAFLPNNKWNASHWFQSIVIIIFSSGSSSSSSPLPSSLSSSSHHNIHDGKIFKL